ncbi:hypothetical protein AMS68_006662 [Peltaster fructicola]|uniref:Amino acid permease/ SLC12A domain-containing protein n=1 Tax=Peltaster fructicola TaxID=286661 RepID=A0A6H0Y2J7_9PEZI|nr:hypothetical protein AMS68_006662 [Peltaster fructicola]
MSEKKDVIPTVDSLSTEWHGQHKDGSQEFIVEQGGNGSLPTYQHADGAPIEVNSPLGYNVQFATIIFLNVGQMIGTGVFSTPSSILIGTGSVGLSLIFWFIGFIMAYAGLVVYLELAAYFPSRSGAEAVYLEQAYPRPRYLMSTAFAIQTVVLSFSASNAIVASTYLFATAGHTPSPWEQKGLAIAVYTLATATVLVSNRAGLYAQNAIGTIKVLTLVFIAITGLVVLGGHTKVAPTGNFNNSFAGTPTGYGISNALYKVFFSYVGYSNAFNLTSEIKVSDLAFLRGAHPLLLIVGTLYVLCAIAYFAAVPQKALRAGGQIAASQFFTIVFGESAARGLNILIVISAFGNLISVLIGQSRLIREVGRQGVLPWPNIWSSVKPFGTPAVPYLLKWSVTVLVILAVPAGDAFNFVVDLAIYPSNFFLLFMSIAVYIIRRQRQKAGIGRGEYRAWDVLIIFSILITAFLLVMPWVPPTGGQYAGDVSFWYATYICVGLGIVLLSGIYWYVWMVLLPKLRGYVKRKEIVQGAGGVTTHQFVNVPKADVAAWDASRSQKQR